MTLSRRTFLKWTTLIAVTASGLPDVARGMARETRYARVLHPVASPDGRQQLLQDSVVSLGQRGVHDFPWLRSSDIQAMPGYLPRNRPAPIPTSFPFLTEVCTPTAPLYRCCDVQSEVVARMGYGSGAWAVDYLLPSSAGSPGWFALADDDGALIGWSQETCWAAVPSAESSPEAAQRSRINHRSQTMSLIKDDSIVAEWQMRSGAADFPSQTYVVRRRVRSGSPDSPLTWAVELANGVRIGGVDWHNDFGLPGHLPQIEIHPFLAKWLYQHFFDGAIVDFC